MRTQGQVSLEACVQVGWVRWPACDSSLRSLRKDSQGRLAIVTELRVWLRSPASTDKTEKQWKVSDNSWHEPQACPYMYICTLPPTHKKNTGICGHTLFLVASIYCFLFLLEGAKAVSPSAVV